MIRSNNWILSGLFLIAFLVGYFWWPHLQRIFDRWNSQHESWWQILDPLLLWNHFLLTFLILLRADIRRDFTIVFVGFWGGISCLFFSIEFDVDNDKGLMIESWGTQTDIWFYYTKQRPPLWIIPAWPLGDLFLINLSV